MISWITGTNPLSSPFIVDKPNSTVVVLGDLVSDHNISFRVKNLIIIGKIRTSQDISIHAQQDCYSLGVLLGKGLDIVTPPNGYHTTLTNGAIAKIKSLGIDIKKGSTGIVIVRPPVSTTSFIV